MKYLFQINIETKQQKLRKKYPISTNYHNLFSRRWVYTFFINPEKKLNIKKIVGKKRVVDLGFFFVELLDNQTVHVRATTTIFEIRRK